MILILSIEGSYVLIFRGVCNFLGSVSSQQKFEAIDAPLLQLLTQKTLREEKPWPNFGSSFYVVFPPPPEPALCKLG